MTDGKSADDEAVETAGAQAAHGEKSRRARRPYRYIRGYQGEGGDFAPSNTHRGRLASWVSVAIFLIGFLLGGIGISLSMNWWLIGIGLGLMAVAGVLFLVSDIFTDVVLDDPRYEAEEPHNTPLHKIKAQDRQRAEGEEGHRAAAEDLPGHGRDPAD
ncbi:MFS transporter [Streptomonospora alba]|uniref:MFS transporter n=1 Tax=Streptomonospora alba TaxID=183763 RepID=UPI001EE6B415|nr:MFS transporter [Streptomonospora alba]